MLTIPLLAGALAALPALDTAQTDSNFTLIWPSPRLDNGSIAQTPGPADGSCAPRSSNLTSPLYRTLLPPNASSPLLLALPAGPLNVSAYVVWGDEPPTSNELSWLSRRQGPGAVEGSRYEVVAQNWAVRGEGEYCGELDTAPFSGNLSWPAANDGNGTLSEGTVGTLVVFSRPTTTSGNDQTQSVHCADVLFASSAQEGSSSSSDSGVNGRCQAATQFRSDGVEATPGGSNGAGRKAGWGAAGVSAAVAAGLAVLV
ncbi:hypothetical protein JCM8097_005838 [Rhodosporidiobolus ruineniae]